MAAVRASLPSSPIPRQKRSAPYFDCSPAQASGYAIHVLIVWQSEVAAVFRGEELTSVDGVGIHSMHTTGSIMPGGGVARRPLHVIMLADCSGSMAGPRIQALNFAIGDMIQHFASWEREQEKRILIRAIAFADEPRWHIQDPMPAATMTWKARSSC
jgi:hypothetical protein